MTKPKPTRMGVLTGISLIVGGGTAATADADTISDSAVFSASGQLNGVGTEVSGETVSLNQFDPSLGTLTGVQFDLTSILGGETILSVSAEGEGGGEPVSASAEGSFTVDVFDSVSSSSLFMDMWPLMTSCEESGSCSNSDTSLSGTMFDDSLSVPVLAGYQGLGMFDVDISQDLEISSFVANTTGPSSVFLEGSWDGELQVTYTFDPIPLPATAWLLGSALIGLSAVRRKKIA